MRPVAVGALFSDIGVFVNKRTLVFHVTTGTKGFGGDALEVLVVGREVRIMAVGAGHLVLRDGVVGELGELHFYLRVAFGA